MAFVKACDIDDVKPGEMLAVATEKAPRVAIFNVDGAFFATTNVCTHAVAMLTDGYLEGDTIECPLHGGMFNVRTGEPTHFPCTEPLTTYAVEVRDGRVFIEMP